MPKGYRGRAVDWARSLREGWAASRTGKLILAPPRISSSVGLGEKWTSSLIDFSCKWIFSGAALRARRGKARGSIAARKGTRITSVQWILRKEGRRRKNKSWRIWRYWNKTFSLKIYLLVEKFIPRFSSDASRVYMYTGWPGIVKLVFNDRFLFRNLWLKNYLW